MASRPSWKTTNETWEWEVSIWEHMAQGHNDTQVAAWLQAQEHALNRDTVGKVRRELESLPASLAEILPTTVQAYWGQFKRPPESTTNAHDELGRDARTITRWDAEDREMLAQDRQPATPVQQEAWEMCRRADHDWMKMSLRGGDGQITSGTWRRYKDQAEALKADRRRSFPPK